MYKFNASFRKSAYAVATEMGMEFISTKRQVENGTLMFNDPQTNVKYAMYESGYIRRLIPTYYHLSSSQNIQDQGHQMYQLNKTHKVAQQKPYTKILTKRIKANPEEQLGILVKSIVNYRNTKPVYYAFPYGFN
jgi:hypothetical protein